MPHFNRPQKQIKGGHSRRPRWHNLVVPTLNIPSELAVWDILLGHFDTAQDPDVVVIGLRALAREAGVSVGAVRRCIADLERRGLIEPLAPGPHGRSRWRMVSEEMPPDALTKPSTLRGSNAAGMTREAGKFHRKVDTPEADLGTGTWAQIGALGTGSWTHDRDDARARASHVHPEMVGSPEPDAWFEEERTL